MANIISTEEKQKKKNKIIKFPELWTEQLIRNENGKVAKTIDNFVMILENCELFKNKICFNELSAEEEFNKKRIETVDFDYIQCEIEKKYGVYDKNKFPSALRIVAKNHCYHPIKDYLNGLKWDGVKRLNTAFCDYLGAENIRYNSMCIRLILFGAIERVFNPRG